MGWGSQSLCYVFYRSLPDCIKDTMSKHGKPVTLPEMKQMAQTIDARYWERKAEKAHESPVPLEVIRLLPVRQGNHLANPRRPLPLPSWLPPPPHPILPLLPWNLNLLMWISWARMGSSPWKNRIDRWRILSVFSVEELVTRLQIVTSLFRESFFRVLLLSKLLPLMLILWSLGNKSFVTVGISFVIVGISFVIVGISFVTVGKWFHAHSLLYLNNLSCVKWQIYTMWQSMSF